MKLGDLSKHSSPIDLRLLTTFSDVKDKKSEGANHRPRPDLARASARSFDLNLTRSSVMKGGDPQHPATAKAASSAVSDFAQ